MKIPPRLQPLIEDGLIDEVLYPLMSGKEASVYVVSCAGQIRAAKVYKDAYKRSFKKAAQYQEGRKVRNSRRARAMEKRSKFGREQQEETWQNAEANALARLAAVGVRVPESYGCYAGVLLMELITDAEGDVASRLNDVTMNAEQAREDFAVMMDYIRLMLCAGIVHGDLSEFNVLLDAYGPVIIDLPQAVDAAGNNNARAMLTRDVNNITLYYSQYAAELKQTRYADELWALFEAGELTPEVELTGLYTDSEAAADVDGIMLAIKDALAEQAALEARKREAEQED
ncbi:PA4780 family RIO1-like protein kinase [Halioxenophilus sp. WMMB6]|uniref:PA4780 family RIO1-like protein kinase n=1 Tax=Halioxenophilus sp. WMMB6 TaxID=3073815 RepID=UPI00295ED5AB|nr:PA4780 family RIO1-like protein kinase [Halioxenophilus sp. WMMB6]